MRSISSRSAGKGPLTPSAAWRSITSPMTAPSASTDRRSATVGKFSAKARRTSPSCAAGSMTSTARWTSASSPSSRPFTFARKPSTPWATLRASASTASPASVRRGPPRGLAVEQFDAELGLQIGNAVGDHRSRAMEPAAGGGETASFDHRQEDLNWSKVGTPGSDISTSWKRTRRFYPPFPNRGKLPTLVPAQGAGIFQPPFRRETR